MKKTVFFLLAVSLSIFSQKAFAQNSLKQGMELLDKKDCVGALPYLVKAVREDPSSKRANLYLGTAYLCLGNSDSAEVYLKLAVRYDEKSAPAYDGLGQIYLKQKNFVDAIKNFRSAIDYNSNNEDYEISLGRAYLGADSLDPAMRAFYRASDLNGKDPRAIEGIGDVYFKQNILEAAIESYKQALKLDSTNIPLMLKLANTYMKSNDGGKAYETFVKISEVAPNNAEAQYQAGELLYTNKRYRDAVPFLAKYHQLKPNDEKTLLQLAESAYEAHMYGDAIKYYQEYQAKHPNSLLAKGAIAAAYFFESKPAESYKIFKTIPMDSMDVKDLARYGLAADAVHDTATTIAAWTRAVTLDTTLQVIQNKLAGVLFSARDYKGAIVHFTKYLALDSTDYAAMLNLGLCYVADHNFESAIQTLKKVVADKPDNYQGALWLARTYSFMDSLDEASNAYQDVIKLALKDTTGRSSDLNEAYRVIATSKIIKGSRLSKASPDVAKANYEDAYKDLVEAVKYAPKDYRTHALLAEDFALMGKIDEACKEIKIVLRTASKNDPTYKRMEKLGKSIGCQ